MVNMNATRPASEGSRDEVLAVSFFKLSIDASRIATIIYNSSYFWSFAEASLSSTTTSWIGDAGAASVGQTTWNAKGKFSGGIVGAATLVIFRDD